jgi:signal transduction histidine kinase
MSVNQLEEKYECDIILSKSFINSEITDYYSKRAMVLDFSPNEEYLGKIVWDDITAEKAMGDKKIKDIILIFWAAVLVLGDLFLILVYIIMVKPVLEMNSYAAEIAKGNLDTELPIHRNNVFGSFTESFDMMRDALKASREREIESEKARKELVAALSHDIKTPVATIQAACEVLDMQLSKKSGDAAAEVSGMKEKVEIISSKAGMINELVSNIFHVTLEELEKIEVTVREENSSIIEQYFTILMQSYNVILENHINECLVYMDKLRMEQVIDNIIGNSHKYAGTEIRVSFDEISIDSNPEPEKREKEKFIRIRISDSGPGVPEEELPLITEKYYRGSDVKEKTGYGLGLYLVKTYMEKQGGGIEYYNENGFVVELLIKKV